MKTQLMNKAMAFIFTISGLISTEAMAQTNLPLVNIAGCSNADFVAGGASNEIEVVGKSYTPRCLKVKVGSSVTIQATRKHPLAAMPDINGIVNPFSDANDTTESQTREMKAPGIFGYYCTNHGDEEGGGMAGVIIVEE